MIDTEFFDLLCRCHAKFVGSPLVDAGASARWLYEDAPFGVLAHNADPDPLFVYANKTAQRAFEYDWAEFVTLRSRLSAEPENREDRQQLLDAVRRDNFFSGYRGRRIAKSGRRFWIEDVTMWNLFDADGLRTGQAAVFPKWTDA
jgi:PAS domain-containing protein